MHEVGSYETVRTHFAFCEKQISRPADTNRIKVNQTTILLLRKR